MQALVEVTGRNGLDFFDACCGVDAPAGSLTGRVFGDPITAAFDTANHHPPGGRGTNEIESIFPFPLNKIENPTRPSPTGPPHTEIGTGRSASPYSDAERKMP